VHLQLLQEIPNDSAMREAWNALVAETDQPQVFYTWEWAHAVHLAYGEELRSWLAIAREGPVLAGLVALALDSQNRAVFLTSATADYCDFLSRPERRPEFVDAVLEQLRQAGMSELSLSNLPADSPTVSALKDAASRHGFHFYSRDAYDCARVILGSPDQRAELKAKLGKKKTFRRSMHALARDGAVQVSHLLRWEQVEPVLPEFANAHIARFLATGRISNLARVSRRLFLHELARLLCETGNLALSRFMMGQKAIAWNYGFRFRGCWFWYQPTFESSLEVHSPGRLLLANMLIEACEDPSVQIFDLGLGAEGYKERVANSSRPTLQVTLSQSPGRITREKVRFRAAQVAKRSPRLEVAIRTTLARIGSMRQEWKDHGAAGFAGQVAARAANTFDRSEEVRFYEWGERRPSRAINDEFRLQPIDLSILASAAMAFENDPETANYLLRSAQRLHGSTQQQAGYALIDASGAPIHFCWVAPFEGFAMAELQTRLSAPVPDAELIFDCWTPQSMRGRGLYATAIAKLAEQVIGSGRSAWIFSAASNQTSARAIERAGFVYRYSMIARKTPLGWKISDKKAHFPAP
jgi:CelD/BcsL family acetyltransferase involved in cellulose biosynthesis